MNPEKHTLLETISRKINDLFYLGKPLADIDAYISKQFYFLESQNPDVSDRRILFLRTLEQQLTSNKGKNLNLYLMPLSREYSLDGKRAIYADLVTVDLENDGLLERPSFKTLQFFEYQGERWHLTQFHCSIYQAGENTLPIEELWAQKQALEKRLADKEKELSQKSENQALLSARERIRIAARNLEKKEGLGDVLTAIYLELNALGLEVLQASVNIFHPEERSIEQWLSPIHAYQEAPFYLKLPSGPWEATSIKDWQEGKDCSFLSIQGENAVQQYARQLDRIMGKDLYERLVKEKVIYTLEQSEANHQYGSLSILQTRKASEEELKILHQFAQEFERIFSLYLELKKSKAQQQAIRLERAQAQILKIAQHIQSSEDISELVLSFAQQLELLGIPVFGVAFSLQLHPEKGTCVSYIVDQNQGHAPKITISEEYEIIKFPLAHQAYQKVLAGEKEFSTLLEGEAIQNWINWTQALMGAERALLLKEAEVEQVYFNWFQIHETAIISFSSFMPLGEPHHHFIQALLDPFTQAFQGFLDLQNTKASSQESETSVTFEPVLNRTLAMQQSEDLAETAQLLFQQINKLGFETWSFGFGIWQENDTVEAWMGADAGAGLSPFHIPYPETAIYRDIFEAYQSGQSEYHAIWEGEALENHYTFLKTIPAAKEALDSREASGLGLPDKQCYYIGFFKQGYLLLITTEPNDALIGLAKRVAPILALTYTRFLDLKKAEAQDREAQIEAALERIRARTMGMQKSAELSNVAALLFKELNKLGGDLWSCGFVILEEDAEAEGVFRMCTPEGEIEPPLFIPNSGDPSTEEMYLAWKAGKMYFQNTLHGEAIQSHYRYMLNLPKSGYVFQAVLDSGIAFPTWQQNNAAYFNKGYLMVITLSPFDDDELLRRFARVFEQTYTRFLDLQKAEEQAREAQIEIALERIRAASMAMQNSNELAEISFMLDSQVRALGIKTRGCAFNIYGENESTEWFSSEKGTLPVYKTPRENVFLRYYEAGQRGESLIINEFAEEACVAHYEYLMSLPVMGKGLREFKKNGGSFPTRQIDHVAFFKYGYLLFITLEPVLEDLNIFKRFAQVFEQTYTRFLDLQKSEAQAREAQIEAALERIRAASMAMHKSEELPQASLTFLRQIEELNISLLGANITIVNERHQSAISYYADNAQQQDSPKLLISKEYKIKDFELTRRGLKQAEAGEKEITIVLEGSEVEHWITLCRETLSEERAQFLEKAQFPKVYINLLPFQGLSNFSFSTLQPLPREERTIIDRLVATFGRSYLRFLDLQKAEAQAREARIEVGLEKVRARTMGMQKSQELAEVAVVLFTEVEKLGIQTWACGFNIWEEKQAGSMVWMSLMGDIQPPFFMPHDQDPSFINILAAAQPGTFYEEEISGLALQKHYEYMFQLPSTQKNFKTLEERGIELPAPPQYQVFNAAYFSNGYLMFITLQRYQDSQLIFKRFARVFEQAYTRFMDLQKAEEQAKEALKQASLDRIRGEIASMRATSDLERITPVVWRELKVQGVPFIRCGVFIVHVQLNAIQVYLSDPEGNTLGNLSIALNQSGTLQDYNSSQLIYENWQSQTVYKDYWEAEQFATFLQSLQSSGQVASSAPLADNPLGQALHLHFIPFSQGMLYVGNTTALEEEAIDMVQELAKTFSIAYARYEDFQEIEASKNKIENTLEELRTTQTQLIQSEKLASLGELTAGIAHEIQNPLNFVNNFSEVSGELIEEMLEEIQNGDLEEVKAISQDLKQNLEKIHHHGKRAEGIVKGMLEHSRSSTGEKTLVDLNTLADEYLRLAYHGLRAKDKSFQSAWELWSDEKLPKIKVAAQDLGRVLLNLINNAFYAVHQKSLSGLENYEPMVKVTTKSLEAQLEIRVEDNGTGIPEEVKEKIFQPFFTTKPTGQGTGLGLSLAYDIITQGHGGSLEVETQSGKGTTFKILLPHSL